MNERMSERTNKRTKKCGAKCFVLMQNAIWIRSTNYVNIGLTNRRRNKKKREQSNNNKIINNDNNNFMNFIHLPVRPLPALQ